MKLVSLCMSMLISVEDNLVAETRYILYDIRCTNKFHDRSRWMDGGQGGRTLRARHAIFIESSSIETELAGTLAKGPYSSRNSRAMCACTKFN